MTPRMDLGSVVHVDSRARKVALTHVEVALWKLIRDKRKEGMLDDGLANIWGHESWSRYGLLRKPDGWRQVAGS